MEIFDWSVLEFLILQIINTMTMINISLTIILYYASRTLNSHDMNTVLKCRWFKPVLWYYDNFGIHIATFIVFILAPAFTLFYILSSLSLSMLYNREYEKHSSTNLKL